MAASVNKFICIGTLGRDPETRYSPSGDAICSISVACSEAWRDKQTGEKKEHTEWIRVSFFGRLAEIAGQYLRKGSQVYIEGSLRTRKWQDKDGNDRYTTEIRADEMKMLGARQDGDAGQSQQSGTRGNRSNSAPPPSAPPPRNPPGGGFGDFDDDIPFNKLGAGRTHLVI